MKMKAIISLPYLQAVVLVSELAFINKRFLCMTHLNCFANNARIKNPSIVATI